MKSVIDIYLFACLSIIAYQDFKQRQIFWFLIPLLFVGFVLKALLSDSSGALFTNSLFNFVFIALQFVFLSIYISIRNGRIINIVNTHIGLGDVLFLLVGCTAFSPLNYIIFYLVSSCVTLLGFGIYTFFSKRSSPEIPLAGAMSVMLILLMFLNNTVVQIGFYNDDYILSMINIL